MAETSVDGLWVIDLDGGTLYANPAVAAMFGASVAEFLELTAFDILDEDGKSEMARHLEDLRAGRANPDPVEVYFVPHHGEPFWTLVSEQILRDDRGEIYGAMHRFSDNDERRRRVDELAESRRELAEAQAIAKLGGFTMDLGSSEIAASQSMCEIYGLDAAETLTVPEWLARVHPDDRPRLQAELETALGDGANVDVLFRVARADGWIWTRGRAVARRDAEGRITGLSGTHQDVTAHKRVELALEREIARNALVQAVATACNEARTLDEALAELRCVIRSRTEWAEVRAYVPDDAGTSLHQVLANLYDARTDQAGADSDLATTALHSGETSWDDTGTVLAFPLHFKGAVHAVITLTAAEIPDDPDETLVAVREAATLLTRVVEREDAERQVAAARDAAVHASQAKSEFLAVMSHEIRTPLNGVIGLNELMLKTSLERRQRELARGIRDAGRSLLRLINDVLDLSKIEAGHLELESVDFDVREVCDQAVVLMGDAARRKGVELAVACSPDVPETLAGDPVRVGQVLTNLVSNAVKFTDEGRVLVKVSSRWAGRRVQLRFDVSDTGEGIAEEALDRVFDDFSQADPSTTRRHGGTGLGLSISRRIVEACEGELSVVSTLGEGSTFTFTAVLDLPRGSRTSPDDDVARSHLSGGRVLVVSQGESCEELIRDQLTLWRTRVDCVVDADDAALAVRCAEKEEDPYEVIVVDIPAGRAPDTSETAELLELAGDPRVFVVMTQRPDTAVVWAVREPTVQVLTKPVTSALLRDALLGVDEDEAPVSATTATLTRQDRPCVLVVEDNAVNQMVARGMLESLGYEVEVAEDGIEAVEQLDIGRHAAVLMDVQMPRMDGYAATRAIRERHADDRRVPVLAMTAAAVAGERERCREAGMDDFLTKPVEINQLGATLARWMPSVRGAHAMSTGTAAPPPLPAELQISSDFRVTRAPAIEEEATPEQPVPAGEQPVEQPDEETVEADTRAVLDSSRLDALLEMGPQAEIYLARAVDNFLAGCCRHIGDLLTAVGAGDQEAVRGVAHKLAGSALNLGLTEVGIASRAIELAEVTDCPEATYAPLVAGLEGALERAVPVLEAYRDSRTDPACSVVE